MTKTWPEKIYSKKEILTLVSDFLAKKNKPLLAVVGPTASGKTDFSIELAKKLAAEVINADSRQFYKYMDVGTAKISELEKQDIPHHLLSFLDPNKTFSVGEFKKTVDELVAKMHAQNKLPMLVGGSGLFVSAVLENYDFPPMAEARRRKELEEKTNEELFAQLQSLDAEAAKKLDASKRNRVMRAIEVFESSAGQSFFDLAKSKKPRWDTFCIGIHVEPDILRERIHLRTRQLWASGFLSEVKNLLKLGYTANDPAMIAHGYREAIDYLHGQISENEALTLMERNTRRYAKRQRTWWRQKEVFWVDIMA